MSSVHFEVSLSFGSVARDFIYPRVIAIYREATPAKLFLCYD